VMRGEWRERGGEDTRAAHGARRSSTSAAPRLAILIPRLSRRLSHAPDVGLSTATSSVRCGHAPS
jgi:ectoine hydroxylase-related dioxygenase (phytanoyl-CoA dioxygenase family)